MVNMLSHPEKIELVQIILKQIVQKENITTPTKRQNSPIFGMWENHEESDDVIGYVNEMRKGRFNVD
jgi:hypothetical protein